MAKQRGEASRLTQITTNSLAWITFRWRNETSFVSMRHYDELLLLLLLGCLLELFERRKYHAVRTATIQRIVNAVVSELSSEKD